MIKIQTKPMFEILRFCRIDDNMKLKDFKLPLLDFRPKEAKISSNRIRLNC